MASKPLITSLPKPLVNTNVSLPDSARHRVIAGATGDDVVAATGIDGIVATLAIDHVDAAVEANVVGTLTADHVLDGIEMSEPMSALEAVVAVISASASVRCRS